MPSAASSDEAAGFMYGLEHFKKGIDQTASQCVFSIKEKTHCAELSGPHYSAKCIKARAPYQKKLFGNLHIRPAFLVTFVDWLFHFEAGFGACQ